MYQNPKTLSIPKAQSGKPYIRMYMILISTQENTPCQLRMYKKGFVCVCNATYCDYLDDPTPNNESEFVVVSTSKAGLRFETTSGLINASESLRIADYDDRNDTAKHAFWDTVAFEKAATRSVKIKVDREKRFQNITGFGGSFTGSVSYLLENLPQELQDHLYKSFYSQSGIGFNLMRTPIGGCDFDLEPWAYNEQPENETTLSNFTKLDPREEKRIEQIKHLKLISNVENLRIKAAAWSPPRWMKTNNAWTGSSRLKKEYYQTWADYHLRWLELWEENGLPLWAISTGNEPTNGVYLMYFLRFMSLGWTPRKQAIWLSENFGPTIRSKYKDLLIFGVDDQRHTLAFWMKFEGRRFAVSNLRFNTNDTNINTKTSLNISSEDLKSSAVVVDSRQTFAQLLIDAGERFSSRFPSNRPLKLRVNRSVEYQKITGFGGAFTGTVSHLLGLLEPNLQDHIYKSYYHQDGIGFNLLRTPIGGCDFDLAPWAYNEEPQNDPALSNFTKLDPRDEVKVEQLQRLKQVSSLKSLKIMALTWSSPTWMKSNGKWTGLGLLKTEYYQAWADYHLS
ncbi:PREDICTED: glucosylceramidase-like [Rhagoletis zephyria]|uniref:glucosylceramidase-like n=1 Tax=Rhagoletis zephyria TaxID=28612 RepID=UPI0008117924|nr:PREDICTED: glucosylceramidase-like [Rhagoletis zephyria]